MHYDTLLTEIVDYVYDEAIIDKDAEAAAYLSLVDAMACFMFALAVPECQKILGPYVPETRVALGVRVPGTPYILDPVKAALDIGACIRWLDYNDTWLAREWGHPSDNLGGILAVADYESQRAIQQGKAGLTLAKVLQATAKAYEIQGILALSHSFNQVGLDHVLLVKVATTAVVSWLMNLPREQALSALSHAWLDGQSLRTYRHAPNVGARKSWAAGDASARGVFLNWMAQRGLPGCASALTTPRWGFQDVLFKQQPLLIDRSLRDFVIKHILFKVAYPAEFHAQTAVECALALYPLVKDRWDAIERIEIGTQKPAMDIIVKSGTLNNEADRDHCLQYIVAVPLLFGALSQESYTDAFAKDERIDALRAKMVVKENPEFYGLYLDIEQRAIPNEVQIFFKDGLSTPKIRVDYPIGHPKRREEAIPLLREKYQRAMKAQFKGRSLENVLELFSDHSKHATFISWWSQFFPH